MLVTELQELVLKKDYGLRFWHVVFRQRGLKFMLTNNRVAWYIGKADGITLGLDSLMSCLGGFQMFDGSTEHPVIWLAQREQLTAVSRYLIQRIHWEDYSLEDLFTLIDAMMDPTLLPLCLRIEAIREYVTRAIV
jgi:hypothetical protein